MVSHTQSRQVHIHLYQSYNHSKLDNSSHKKQDDGSLDDKNHLTENGMKG